MNANQPAAAACPVTLDAYRRVVETLALQMKPKALQRALERLHDEADRSSAANVIPLRGGHLWSNSDDRRAYGAALTDIINRLEKCS